MEVILREHVDNLGKRGEIVKVADGYARNYLLPRKLALPATDGNRKHVERERKIMEMREAEEKSGAEAIASRLATVDISIARRVGDTEQLYGSVTSADIVDYLKAKGFEVDRRKLILPEPIKAIGEYDVPLKLHREVTLPLKVKVVKEGAAKEGSTAPATGLAVSRDLFDPSSGHHAPVASFHVVGDEAQVTFDVPLDAEDDPVMNELLLGEAIEVQLQRRQQRADGGDRPAQSESSIDLRDVMSRLVGNHAPGPDVKREQAEARGQQVLAADLAREADEASRRLDELERTANQTVERTRAEVAELKADQIRSYGPDPVQKAKGAQPLAVSVEPAA